MNHPKGDGRLGFRRAQERGRADHGWLESYHTFSFADYRDPNWMGFRALRVINDDRVKPSNGFPRHGHRDMEIVSYVLEGALEHKDSMGTGSVIRPGDVQRMSAGTGVLHSEYNASSQDLVHFLQIWLIPTEAGMPPSYEQKTFADSEKRGRLRVVASPDGRNGSVTVHSDAVIAASVLGQGDRVDVAVAPGRHAWVHVAKGRIRVEDVDLFAGDAVFTSAPGILRLSGAEKGDPAEIIAFDLG